MDNLIGFLDSGGGGLIKIILSFSAAVTPIKGLLGDEKQQFVAFSAYVGTGGEKRVDYREDVIESSHSQ
ncbi:hypothetical protein [Acetobacter orientalis]|uniref:hypothetical protein n=1 Tax=Acetobacter orientalis TaxID=146474 RepID=UPI0039ED6BBA